MSDLDMAKARVLIQGMAGEKYRNYPSLPESICFARDAASMLPAAIERISELVDENQHRSEMEESRIAENEVLREEIVTLQLKMNMQKRAQERLVARCKELSSRELTALNSAADQCGANLKLRKQIDSWIEDRDRWIARYEAAQKEIAALQERIRELEDANSKLQKEANDRWDAWEGQSELATGLQERIGNLTVLLIEVERICLWKNGYYKGTWAETDKEVREDLHNRGLL